MVKIQLLVNDVDGVEKIVEINKSVALELVAKGIARYPVDKVIKKVVKNKE